MFKWTYPFFANVSTLKLIALANIAVIGVAELSAVATWYALYGVHGSAVMITAAITCIASALPLITVIIYMAKKLERATGDLAVTKIKIKNQVTNSLIRNEQQNEISNQHLAHGFEGAASPAGA